jgi:preprotein translocase subunit SecD
VAPPSRSAPHPWRALTGLIVIILVMLFTILGSATISPGKWQHQFKVGLGLDLSSGTQVTLAAQAPKGKQPQTGEMQQAIDILLARVNGTGNSGAQVEQVGPDLINVSVPGKAAQDVINLISTTAEMRVRQVYLFEPYSTTSPSTAPTTEPSGTATPSGSASPSASNGTTTPSPSAGTKASPNATSTKSKTTAYIVHNAPAVAASATPTSSATGNPTSSPTPTSSSTAKASATPTATASPTASAPSYLGDASLVNAATMKLFNKMVCKPSSNPNVVDESWKGTVGYTGANSATTYNDSSIQTVSCDSSGDKYALGPAVFSGGDITSVQTGLLQDSGQYVVNIQLDGKATSAFSTLSQKLYNNYYVPYSEGSGTQDDEILAETAIVLDGDMQSAPVTEGVIPNGQVQISGPQPNGFSSDQANQLANLLKYGQLPLTFVQQNVSSISPQLGHDSLVAGLTSGIIGLILIIIYLFVYYRGLGLVSVSSLLIAALLAYLAVVLLSRYQNFTMELSGIAGLIVAIGITADSFIVFFERLRDEVREGKALRPAVESGWKRARRTIIVSDTVSFLAAVLLYHFAVSDVQGFAYTLGLTTLIDILVVFLFTKPMVTVLAGTKFYGGGHKWSGLDPARLGAKNPWRGGRRTVRAQGSAGIRPATGSTTTTEA